MQTEEILKTLNFQELTEVQKQAIPLIRSGQDILVLSPTGSGKTYAFLIPLATLKTSFSALIIAPTRELVVQIKEFYDKMKLTTTAVGLFGGKNIEEDIKLLKKEPQVVISTPGRITEILKIENFFKKTEFLILDEADKLFQLGFMGTLNRILPFINDNRTTALFSATLNVDFSPINLKNPKIINTTFEQKTKLFYCKLSGKQKLEVLFSFIKNRKGKLIVFFSTCVDFFHSFFSELGISISKIHGRLRQKERENVYKDYEILFSTDLAARGIDFEDVKTVIHFDMPVDPSNFTHRSGRTGRNGKEGEVFLFVSSNEHKYLNYLEVKNILIEEIVPENYNEELKLKTDSAKEIKTDSSKEIKTYLPTETKTYLPTEINEELLLLSVKAFVSFIRSYKEHVLSYILNYKEIDFNQLAEMYFLKKIPRMDELKNIKFDNFIKGKNDKSGNKNSIKVNKEKKYKNKSSLKVNKENKLIKKRK